MDFAKFFQIMWAILALLLLDISHANEEMLYSLKNDTIGWKSVSAPGRTKNGWNLNNKSGAYEVCDYKVRGADNKLVSPFIVIKDALAIEVVVKFETDACEDLTDADNSCSEDLRLGYIPANGDIERPGTSSALYEVPTVKIREDGDELSNNFHRSVIEYSDYFQMDNNMLSHRGLFLVLADQGSCSIVRDVIVKYYFCPSVEKDLSVYPRSPATAAAFREVSGECASNAVSNVNPRAKCSGLGDWKSSKNTCKCDAGFERVGTECQHCRTNFYKSQPGNSPCRKCPAFSTTESRSSFYGRPVSGARSCHCEINKFRIDENDFDSPCIGLPSNPRNVSADVDWLKATIQWQPALQDGGDGAYPVTVWYSVQCTTCKKELVYSPQWKNIQGNSVSVSGLQPSTSYTFRVYSENVVSDRFDSKVKSFKDVTFITNAAAFVRDLRVEQSDWSGPPIVLRWDRPEQYVASKYCVRVFSDNENIRFHTVNSTRFVPVGLQPGNYAFDVSSYGCEGPFSGQVRAQITEERILSQHRAQRITLTIVLLVFVLLLLTTILAIAMCIYRKKKNYASEYAWTNASHLVEYTCGPTGVAELVKVGKAEQAFMDPRQFEPIERMVAEFVRDVNPDYLTINETDFPTESCGMKETIGFIRSETSFEEKTAVNVKFLREPTDEKEWRYMVIEAATMSQLVHPNVLMIHGISMYGANPVLITEVAEMGSIDVLLSSNPCKFSTMQIVHMLRGVACGMQYLSEEGFVHKAIRGSNILVTKSQVCKVAGFDMRTRMEEQMFANNGESDILEAMAPWCSIEVLSARLFSSASDVWAFACLMWECLSNGQQPLAGCSSVELYKWLEQGNRLNVPTDVCPPQLYELMQACWLKDPQCRPWFCSLRTRLEHLMRSPRNIISPTPTHNNNYYTLGRATNEFLGNPLCRYQTAPSTSVLDMLKDLNMAEKYWVLFEQQNYRYVDELQKEISKDFLKGLGITSKKDRLKILNHVENLSRSSFFRTSTANSPIHYTGSPLNLYAI